jgi:hypothetical protein
MPVHRRIRTLCQGRVWMRAPDAQLHARKVQLPGRRPDHLSIASREPRGDY